MTDKFILDGHQPVAEPNLIKWGTWFETADRKVAKTVGDKYYVSTVFLGLDHSFGEDGPPILFETMVFPVSGKMDKQDMDRYATWEEAEEGHQRMVKKWLTKSP